MQKQTAFNFLLALTVLIVSGCAQPQYFDPLPGVRFGVNAHMPEDPVLDALEETDVKWLRLSIPWSHIEVEQGVYEWEFPDDRVAEISSRGYHIFLSISETPARANTSGSSNLPPDNPALWEEFMFQVSSRYSGQVEAYGIWNEPNDGGGEYFDGTPEEFRDLILIPGCRGVRRGDPYAKIAAPGITVHTDWSEWMEPIFTEEVREMVDIVSVHVYTRGNALDLFWDVDYRDTNLGDIKPVEYVLRKLNLEEYPLWIEETGWPTGGEMGISEEEQAAFLNELLIGLSEREEIDRTFWYDVVDDPAPGDPYYNFGLFHEDLTPKPAVEVFYDFRID